MCRLFGQISAAPAPAFDFLVGTERSLLRQADFDPRNPQEDGWGLGWWEGGSARVAKSPGAAFREVRRFRGLAARVRSRVVLGHIRAASNPKGLPKTRVLGPDNAQPFTDGRFVFAHNGTVSCPDELAATLGDYRKRLRGVNDSEVYFWQFVRHFDRLGSVPRALRECVREIHEAWRKAPSRRASKKAPYTGLNAVVSDGRSLHALCHYPREAGGSVFNPAQPWGRMSLARRGERVVIASEDLDSGPWERLNDPEIVSVEPRGGAAAGGPAAWRVTRRSFDPKTGRETKPPPARRPR